jgi:hypothetical protein
MGYFVKIDLFFERIHDLGEFNRIPEIFSRLFFENMQDE